MTSSLLTHPDALLTDLYELTMLSTYHELGMDDDAVFEFFVRGLPENRNFLMAAGLEQLLEYLENLHFTPDELDWLAECGHFSKEFVDHLRSFRFSGDVHAVPEGTLFFANEPIVRVTAPLPQAQLIESRLINIIHYQSLIATKAARCVLAAPGKMLVDFGMRRAHGAEAAMFAARATYLAGFTGTATVLAGKDLGIPVYGTMAHSYVQAHDHELDAFRHFSRSHPDNTILLIDTYSIPRGAELVVALAEELRGEGISIKAVRIDSGDLIEGAREVRSILDQGGCSDIGIFCSGGLDEYELDEIVAAGAPVDGFGIGTHLDVSTDAPYLDCAYKLEEYAGRARRKRSEGKATWPGRKQVYREYDRSGFLTGDTLGLEDDLEPGEALLKPVMRDGKRTASAPSLADIREHASAQLQRLPGPLRDLRARHEYPVRVSQRLEELVVAVDKEFG